MAELHEWEGGRGESRAEALRELLDLMDRSAPAEGGALILFELGREPSEDPVALAEELGRAWGLTGRQLLVVDGHPARPFLSAHFGPEEEGFTEILHYGLSPGAVTRKREGAPGLWIPAGSLGDLELEDPAEPARGLRRLRERADRVLLLASTRNDEGWLKDFRRAADFRLGLGEPEIDRIIAERAARRHRVRVPLLVAMSIVAAAAVAWMLWPEEDGALRPVDLPERREEAVTPPALTPPEPELARADESIEEIVLDDEDAPVPAGEATAREEAPPEEALWDEAVVDEAPGGGNAASSSAHAEEEAAEPPPETVAEPPAQSLGEQGFAEAEMEPEAEDRGFAEAGVVETPPLRLLRRFESGAEWERILDHSGTFYVHVGSYRDSVRAARSVALEGFSDYPVRLHPVPVQGQTWYRVCVGKFKDLPTAVAFRDSLLDSAGYDYCPIGINTEP